MTPEMSSQDVIPAVADLEAEDRLRGYLLSEVMGYMLLGLVDPGPERQVLSVVPIELIERMGASIA